MTKHEYRILSRDTQGKLADVVEEFLNAGWQLAGGVFVLHKVEKVGIEMIPDTHFTQPAYEEVLTFYQAILRYIHDPSIGKEAMMDHKTGEVIYSEN